MIKHIVMWKFKENAEGGTRAENMEQVKEKLLALRGVVPEIKGEFRIVFADMDYALKAKGFHLSLIADYDDLSALLRYRDHPSHKAVAEFVHKVIEERACIDFPLESM